MKKNLIRFTPIFAAGTFLAAFPLHLQAQPEAAQKPGGALGFLFSFFPLIAFGLIFYFLLFRPQQKSNQERRKMIDNLKKGDKVLTNGGIFGTVVALRGEVVDLKLADNLKVELSRHYVARVVPAAGNGAPQASGQTQSASH